MFRIGQSTDIHKFGEGSSIVLGGVEIPSSFGIVAHSDGDALCHAVAESILGALALGDLGYHFPDTDEQYANVSSIKILAEVIKKMQALDYEIQNLDALILIEKPKMAPYIDDMRENISRATMTHITNVSIKATRGEKIGFVGRQEGVVCQCVTLLRRRTEHE